MKFIKRIALLSLASSFSAQANVSCLDITSQNPETFVFEQHPVSYVNCYCNCAQWRWLDDSRCTMCNHKHGGNGALLTNETDGTFISFMSPTQAADYDRPQGSDWIETLKNMPERGSVTVTPPRFSE